VGTSDWARIGGRGTWGKRRETRTEEEEEKKKREERRANTEERIEKSSEKELSSVCLLSNCDLLGNLWAVFGKSWAAFEGLGEVFGVSPELSEVFGTLGES